jgi:hypothetical protein
MIYETDTNRVLVWDNAAWVMIADTDTPPGLELVKTQTVGTTVSSVEVTGAFSSTYQNYKIVYSGGTASGAIGPINMRLGSSTASYYSAATYSIYSSATNGNVSRNNGSEWYYAGAANNTVGTSLNIDVLNPFDSTKYTMFGGPFMVVDVAGSTGGVHAVNASYTSFTLLTASGTISGGTIYVYGYRNSI